MAKKPQSFIYFAHCGATGLIKVGCTATIDKRIRHLKTESGNEARLLHHWRGDFKKEAALHKQFADCHAGHEWYRAEGTVLEFLHSEIWGRKIPPHDPARNRRIGTQNRRYTLTIKRNRKAYAAMMSRIAAGSG